MPPGASGNRKLAERYSEPLARVFPAKPRETALQDFDRRLVGVPSQNEFVRALGA